MKNEALCFCLVTRNLQNFKYDKMECTMVHVYKRGLVVSVSFILGIAEPRVRDMDHTVPRFCYNNINNVSALGLDGTELK